jgi:hypothetical protein
VHKPGWLKWLRQLLELVEPPVGGYQVSNRQLPNAPILSPEAPLIALRVSVQRSQTPWLRIVEHPPKALAGLTNQRW